MDLPEWSSDHSVSDRVRFNAAVARHIAALLDLAADLMDAGDVRADLAEASLFQYRDLCELHDDLGRAVGKPYGIGAAVSPRCTRKQTHGC